MRVVTDEVGNSISDWTDDSTLDEIRSHMASASQMQERPSYRDRDDDVA